MSGDRFHLKWPRWKHEENSPQGDREAVREGYTSTDHDWQKDADGVVQNTHWKDVFARDDFHDPRRIYGVGDKFDTLPSAAVARLIAIADAKVFRIRTAAQGIRHAASVGLNRVYGEAKPGNDWTVRDFREHKHVARTAGIGLTVMTMDNWPHWRRTLWRARLAGCRTQRIRASR